MVTADPPTWTEVTRQARAITIPTGLRDTPLPRFEGDRLCPGVMGMKGEYAEQIIGRLRANAEHFGLWMSEDDGTCQLNFVVAVVDDGKDTFQQIADQWPNLLSDVPRPERIALMAQEGGGGGLRACGPPP